MTVDNPMALLFRPLERTLLELDPPDHTRLRQLAHQAFTSRLIERMLLVAGHETTVNLIGHRSFDHLIIGTFLKLAWNKR
jgi:cytochrome P450